MLETIDFGQLSDPIETPKKRAGFCGRVVVAKPIIAEINRRMLREIGRDYFGNTKTLEELAYVNGMIDYAKIQNDKVIMFESEHIGNKPEDKEEEPGTASSGSNLSL